MKEFIVISESSGKELTKTQVKKIVKDKFWYGLDSSFNGSMGAGIYFKD